MSIFYLAINVIISLVFTYFFLAGKKFIETYIKLVAEDLYLKKKGRIK